MVSHSKCCVTWLSVKGETSDKWHLQECILGSVLFYIFFGDMDGGLGCTLSEFVDGTKLCGVVNMLEGRDA